MPTPVPADGTHIALGESLCIGDCGPLRGQFTDLLAKHTGLTIDLAHVASCDVAGLQLLLSARKTAQHAGKSFRVTQPPAPVVETATALGLALNESI